MKLPKSLRCLSFSVILVFISACNPDNSPVTVSWENPHYFSYNSKPIILISSDHTYFAVIAEDFDYVKFIDKLAAFGNNFTRIYPGAHPVQYINQPRIFPWVKEPSGRYNLDLWDENYFKRLHSFMSYAQSKGVIVDLVLFNGFGLDSKKQYQWRWEWSPLNDSMNTQDGVGTKRDYFCTLEEPKLVEYQKAYVRKLVMELNKYNNLIYDIADEPDFFNAISDSLVNPWINVMMDEVINTESSLPKKHLISETFHPSLENNGIHWGADSRTNWISVEYSNGLQHFEKQYSYNKPYVQIETTTPVLNPLGFWKWEYGPDASRIHSWAFLVAGGAGFMEFNDDYDSQFPAGRPPTDTILKQKKVLKDFLHRFDFVKMKHFTDFKGINGYITPKDTTGIPWGTGIAEPGKQYTIYICHSYLKMIPQEPGYFKAVPGSYCDSIVLRNVPANSYGIEWINPADGALIKSFNIDHNGGDLVLHTADYKIDIALKMTAN